MRTPDPPGPQLDEFVIGHLEEHRPVLGHPVHPGQQVHKQAGVCPPDEVDGDDHDDEDDDEEEEEKEEVE